MAQIRTVTTTYENLKGVDFSRDASLVDRNRSPYCLNMMPDESKSPVKRPGWKTMYSLEGQVHNIWFCTLKDKKYMLCHCGNKIYLLDDEAEVLKDGVTSGKGCGFYAIKGDEGAFYILTSGEYLVFDGETITAVADSAYVPLVAISKSPGGDGEAYEDINFINPKRKEGFVGTESDLVYQLGCDNIQSVDKVEIKDADGNMKTLTADTDYTADLTLGKVTFVKAQPAAVKGEDNVFVTYTKNVYGYKEKIEKCTICAQFGLGGENRVFLSGNADCKERDFWSGIYDPSYFPDLNYSIIGNGQTAVMGYLKLGEYLGIVKEGNGQDTSLFMRRAAESDGKTLFSVSGGISGVGAVSKHCFAMLGDEPLFLSSRGVYAVASSVITSEKVIANRSYQIDARLTKEENLCNAVACVWKHFYILSVNGNCYLMDSRQIVSAKEGEKNSRYECYFWNNVEADCFAVDADKLWFGTQNGQVRCFKDELEGKTCYSDDGEAICAVWHTAVEDEGCVEYFKTLRRRGCAVTLKPYSSSSCQIYYSVDGKMKKLIKERAIDIFSFFGEVNFDRFSFDGSEGPREIYFNRRQRRYKRLQLIFENNALNEGFGIYKITKTYSVNNYSKNRRD